MWGVDSATTSWCSSPTWRASRPGSRAPRRVTSNARHSRKNATPSGRLEVVPVDGTNPEVSVSDVFGGATIGPIDYSNFGGYLIAVALLVWGAVQLTGSSRAGLLQGGIAVVMALFVGVGAALHFAAVVFGVVVSPA